MNSPKKAAIIFLSVINLMNILAGIITQVEMMLGSDVTSIIPIKAEMTVIQILIANFLAVVMIMFLISIVTTYLVTDILYSPKEIISNCPGLFMVIPVLMFFAAVVNAIGTDFIADKVWIIASGIFYVFANVINFGCILTIKEDMD